MFQRQMTEERKRFVISITAAAVLHIAVLLLTGLNSFDYTPAADYGPLYVELTPPVREPEELPPPEEEPPPASSDTAADTAEEPAPAAVKPDSGPAAVPDRPARPQVPEKQPAAPEPDDTIQNILSNMSSERTVDARGVFGGDDRVAASSSERDLPTASGTESGSEVELSQYTAAAVEDGPRTASGSAQQPESLTEGIDWSRFDSQQSDPGSSSSGTETSGAVTSPVSGDGQSRSIVFSDPSRGRSLLSAPEPDIPDEIARSVNKKYVVVIEFMVDEQGLISEPRIKTPSGSTALDSAVINALRKWAFQPSRAGSGGGKSAATLSIYNRKIVIWRHEH